jgi:hypothetical protein
MFGGILRIYSSPGRIESVDFNFSSMTSFVEANSLIIKPTG